LLYPSFSESYSVTSHGDITNPWFGKTNVITPSAELEISAGDYDSAFGTVDSTSHFHIGPVHLSNGEVLTGNNIYISGRLFNNNPTSTVPLTSWERFTSADTNIANIHSGIFSKFGSLIATYNQAFSTPDILTLEAKASLGSAVVKKTTNLPIQPPV